MRINKFVALATGKSRRSVDKLIDTSNITVNGKPATIGQEIGDFDEVLLNGKKIITSEHTTIMLNKPTGYVCSRDGQGSATIYDLLPKELHQLKPIGRLDKDSSGLLLLTNDGDLAHRLTHPKFNKLKLYKAKLNKPITISDKAKLARGIMLSDGLSKLVIAGDKEDITIKMSEGRNRQIRRTLNALGYKTIELHRTNFGDYALNAIKLGKYTKIS